VITSNCIKCGKCCRVWSNLSITKEDISRWQNTDMMKYVVDNEVWFDPETKERLQVCPFLIDNTCSIHPGEDGEDGEDKRPSICRKYPMDKECLNDTLQKSIRLSNGNELNITVFKYKSGRHI